MFAKAPASISAEHLPMLRQGAVSCQGVRRKLRTRDVSPGMWRVARLVYVCVLGIGGCILGFRDVTPCA